MAWMCVVYGMKNDHKKLNTKDEFLPNIDNENTTALHLSKDLYKSRDFFVSLVCSM